MGIASNGRAALVMDPVRARLGALNVPVAILAVILVVAAGLRFWHLGELSFWYDEVVSMRLAQARGLQGLSERLFQIDATRAPLHPVLLQGWITLFGSSEASGRALSAVCGVATVALVYGIGSVVFGKTTGLLAAWLAAISPPLVYYSREARMYAWLVMATCVCWWCVFSLRKLDEPRSRRGLALMAGYALGLAALFYSHPLGLLMGATLALGSLPSVRKTFGGFLNWLYAHFAAFVLVGPWLPYYFDHRPEFVTGRLPLKFLIGTPIGFIGGNFIVLAGLSLIAAYGLVRRFRDRGSEATPFDWADGLSLFVWLVVPPCALYAYSRLIWPIFGPSRYTLFVAPAYLILVAQGVAALPLVARSILAIALSVLALSSLGPQVYAPDLKADWRSFGRDLAIELREHPERPITIAVVDSRGMLRPTAPEVETARYYVPAECRVWPTSLPTYVTISPKVTLQIFPWGASLVLDRTYPGLQVYRVEWKDAAHSSNQKSAASAR